MLQFVSAPDNNAIVVNLANHGALLEVEESHRSPEDVGDSVALTEEGYATVGRTCCVAAMEAFVRRVIDDLGLEICNEGGFQGAVSWHTCEHGVQSLEKL